MEDLWIQGKRKANKRRMECKKKYEEVGCDRRLMTEQSCVEKKTSCTDPK